MLYVAIGQTIDIIYVRNTRIIIVSMVRQTIYAATLLYRHQKL